MMFAQMTGRASLRNISDSLSTQAGSLYHLGIRTVKRPTLVDANHKRSTDFFQVFFAKTYQHCAVLAPGKKKFRFKNKLSSLDTSIIGFCLSIFPWARFRSTKGEIKLYTILGKDGYILAFTSSTTNAKVSDLFFARTLTLPTGSIVVLDGAYIYFAWLYALTKQKNYFIIHLRSNIKYRVTEQWTVLKNKDIISDRTIILEGPKAGNCPIPFHEIGFINAGTRKQYFFLTNNFHLVAKIITDIYKALWEIELFLMWLKEGLKIKQDVPRNFQCCYDADLDRPDHHAAIRLYEILGEYLTIHYTNYEVTVVKTCSKIKVELMYEMFFNFKWL